MPSPARRAAPVGVVSSTGWPVPCTGAPRSSRTTAGRGIGQTAMGAVQRADPQRDRAGAHGGHIERLQGQAAADDVHNGVQAPDLVKVDVVRAHAVDVAFSRSQRCEHRQSPLASSHRQTGGAMQEPSDRRPGPVDKVVLRAYDHQARGAEAATDGLFRLQAPPPDRQAPEPGPHFVQVRPSVQQAAQGHVAGDPRKTVPPGSVCHSYRATAAGRAEPWARSPKVRPTAQAAPKPLSMPTTHRPGAQLESMASKAVTPCREAP